MAAAVAAMAAAVVATVAAGAVVDVATAAVASGAVDRPAAFAGAGADPVEIRTLARVCVPDRYWRRQRLRPTDEILAQSREARATFDLPACLATRGTFHPPITACAAPCEDRSSQAGRTPGALCLIDRALRQIR